MLCRHHGKQSRASTPRKIFRLFTVDGCAICRHAAYIAPRRLLIMRRCRLYFMRAAAGCFSCAIYSRLGGQDDIARMLLAVDA